MWCRALQSGKPAIVELSVSGVLVPLGPLVHIATTRPTTRYATMVIPSYEVSAASGALVTRIAGTGVTTAYVQRTG